MNILKYLPIQWWVLKTEPIISNPSKLSKSPYISHWYKTTWKYVLTGKHHGNKLKLGKP